MGFEWKNITAAELIDERVAEIKCNFPLVKLLHGDANLIDENEKFDVIFQSTVFTSILDSEVKKALAQKMLRMLSPNGIIIWYDFVYNNPANKDVKGVPKTEILKLFSGCRAIRFRRVTLAPPIGRRIGRLYPVVNFLFPFKEPHRCSHKKVIPAKIKTTFRIGIILFASFVRTNIFGCRKNHF